MRQKKSVRNYSAMAGSLKEQLERLKKKCRADGKRMQAIIWKMQSG